MFFYLGFSPGVPQWWLFLYLDGSGFTFGMSAINVSKLKKLVTNFTEELASILDEGVSFALS